MITGITGGRYLSVVANGGTTYYNSSSQPMAGAMRYHSGGRVEVFDGNSWMQVSSYGNIELTPDAQAALDWALKKIEEEKELEKLSKEHPAVKAAYESLKRAEEQLKVTVILSKEQPNNIDYHPV